MKTSFSFFLITILSYVCLQTSCTSAANKAEDVKVAAETLVGQHGPLSVKGVQLTDSHGNPIVLKGVSFGWHNWWFDFYTDSAVDQLVQDWNAHLIRAAIGVEPEGAYLSNPELAIECCTTVVDAAIRNGVYAIIDWHSHGTQLEAAKEFFTAMSGRYKDSPNVIYEIFNEPVEQSWEELKAYSIELIDIIRKNAPNSVIIVGVPHWDQDVHLAAADPITGYDNLMYGLHFYAATHKQYLRDRGSEAIAMGLPIFVSECAGMTASGDGPIDSESWSTWVQWMNKHQISWAAWSVSGKEESCSMLLTATDPAATWQDCDIREWGRIVKNRLRMDNE